MENLIFFGCYLNTTICEFNNFNIFFFFFIQKKFVGLHEMGEEIKSSLLLTL